ncbi:WYL domain-containing protein [Kribbella sandramycini]|uniref:Putative DNA-binding transcriptional regulator YafY n=1 Tax=Kribbella sandramycini TaxID=60450 RepID=A0A7Y4NXG8_9ACTN|nr:WYL domain-containing protein [Kribbella sandramycini]MBB6568697.1 putative DNA-binding transcriptional regulator YafY [Kribbella sandramycini]NOL38718.1 WYL domain-containing protein [Kribbella sandramycini]
MADVTARMLALLSTLQTGREFSGDELVQRLGVSPRTLRRDVDRLRSYGYPVQTQPGPGGYYRLAAGRTMPPLVLDDDEAVATLLALASLGSVGSASEGGLDAAATRAYGKVDQFLPLRLRERAVSVRASVETSHQAAPSVPAEQLGELADAIGKQQTISFDYLNARGEQAIRRVEPHRQIHHLLRWYLLAWDLDRADWRVFRVDRLRDLRRSTTRFTARPLPAESATAYLRQGLQKAKHTVRVTIDAPAETVIDAFKYQDADIRPLDPQHTELTLALDSWHWLLLPLASLEADFHLTQAPPEFLAAYRTFGDRFRAAITS